MRYLLIIFILLSALSGCIGNSKPEAKINAQAHGIAGDELLFDAGKSTDTDGWIVSYYWDFGDGEFGYGKNVKHIFKNEGIYIVKLKVKDNNGAEAIKEMKISIIYYMKIDIEKINNEYLNKNLEVYGNVIDVYGNSFIIGNNTYSIKVYCEIEIKVSLWWEVKVLGILNEYFGNLEIKVRGFGLDKVEVLSVPKAIVLDVYRIPNYVDEGISPEIRWNVNGEAKEVRFFYSINNSEYKSTSAFSSYSFPPYPRGTVVKYYICAYDIENKLYRNPAYLVYSYIVGNFKIYYGNLHSHTILSDGIGMPNEAYNYAFNNASIDSLAITDHTHMLSQEEYDTIIESSNKFENFFALFGQEFGSLYYFGHITVFSSKKLIPVNRDDLDGLYRWLDENKLYGTFNHPSVMNFNSFEYSNIGDKWISSIEIFNGKYEESYESEYIFALNKGWHVGVVANQDNHNGNWGNDRTRSGKIYLTGIIANGSSNEDILDAISKHRTYALQVNPPWDRIELFFNANNYTMGDVVKYKGEIIVNLTVKLEALKNFSKIELYYDDEIIKTDNISGNKVSWNYSVNIGFGNHYFFIKAEQEDGDLVVSSPIWFEEL
ncbi:MAG: PKD domain-containing protein [Candidatus Thermoplasmatota archaeon]